MFRKTSLILTALTVVLAALVLTAPAEAARAKSFSAPGGTFVSDWYWLGDEGDSASWSRFRGLREVDCKDAKIQVEALVSDAMNGGAGHDKPIQLVLSNIAGTYTVPLFLDNTAAVTMEDSQGEGWAVSAEHQPAWTDRDWKKVCGWARAKGQLEVGFVWQPTVQITDEDCCAGAKDDPSHLVGHPHPVAVNQASVQLF
jgi:hypothetical protein